MRRNTRSRTSKARGHGQGWFYWLLATVTLGVLAWLWWHGGALLRREAPAARPVAEAGPRPPAQTSAPAGPLGPRAAPDTTALSNLLVQPLAGAAVRTNTVPAAALALANPAAVATPTDQVRPPAEAMPAGGRLVRDVFEAQVALERLGFSSGSLDGVLGSQTRAALRAFQRREGLRPSGELDAATRARLWLERAPTRAYTVLSTDLGRLRPLSPTWLGKSQQDRLDYETLLERIAEFSHAHPNLLRRLNPGVDFSTLAPGAVVQVPDAYLPPGPRGVSFVRIRLGAKTLEAFDARANLLLHCPCSIARRVEKRPVGTLHVAVLVPDPDYTFNPAIFPESAEGRRLGRKLLLPPGPNNPVGTAWIGLDRPGYGIHGTPQPEAVGRTESHGCFRLANWNVEHLIQQVRVGTPVLVEP